jgi:hypothetical protein
MKWGVDFHIDLADHHDPGRNLGGGLHLAELDAFDPY